MPSNWYLNLVGNEKSYVNFDIMIKNRSCDWWRSYVWAVRDVKKVIPWSYVLRI